MTVRVCHRFQPELQSTVSYKDTWNTKKGTRSRAQTYWLNWCGPTLQLGPRCPICPPGHQSACHWVDKCQCVLTIPSMSARERRDGGSVSCHSDLPVWDQVVAGRMKINGCRLQDVNTGTDIIPACTLCSTGPLPSGPAVFNNSEAAGLKWRNWG